MSLNRSPVSSKLLISLSKIGTSMSAAPIPQTQEHVYNVRSSDDHILLTMYPAERK